MALPNYVKISKNGVEFLDGSDRANYCISELTRAALRDVGKMLRIEFRKKFQTVFHRITGKGGNNLNAWVPATTTDGKKVQNAVLYVGYTPGKVKATASNVTKNKARGFYASFQEKGSKNIQQRGILMDLVNIKLNEIRRIEAQYLSAIDLPDSGESLIDEREELSDDN